MKAGIRSAELRHFGNIERRIKGHDDTGEPTNVWEVWARDVHFAIDDWRPVEAVAAGQVQDHQTVRLRIRYRPGVSPTMRVAHVPCPGIAPEVTDYYDIEGIIHDPTMQRDLQLECRRRDPLTE